MKLTIILSFLFLFLFFWIVFDFENMERLLPKTKKARRFENNDAMNPIFIQPIQPQTDKEVTFTMAQVKEIVKKALQERDQALRVEYDNILREKLQEQFDNFSKFNQDYISRQMKESQWDCMIFFPFFSSFLFLLKF